MIQKVAKKKKEEEGGPYRSSGSHHIPIHYASDHIHIYRQTVPWQHKTQF